MNRYISAAKYFVVIVPFIAFLSACASKPTAENLANADYGAYPTEYEQIVKGFLNQLLKDPVSARWRKIHSPRTQWSSYLGSPKFGYVVCFGINAKNSYGGYTGEKLHFS